MKSKYRISGSVAVALLLLCTGLNWTTNVNAQENETIEGSTTARREIVTSTITIGVCFTILLACFLAVGGLLLELEATVLGVGTDTLLGRVEAIFERIADAVATFMAGDSGFAELISSMCAGG